MYIKFRLLISWFFSHVELKNIFIPLSTKRFIPLNDGKGWKGVLDVYVFGIRIARFDLTSPWDFHGKP